MAFADPRSDNEPSARSDAALAAEGDRRAFERLYRANVRRVYSLCLRMAANRELADELTQDVFVRAWEKIAQFRGESAFSTWLHKLAVNVVLNAVKSERKRGDRFLYGAANYEALPQQGHSAGGFIDLESAIASLPAGARAVFVLHDVEGYRHEDIGEILGITAGGSKAQLHRARMLLRERLER